jgi:hypothetical protein
MVSPVEVLNGRLAAKSIRWIDLSEERPSRYASGLWRAATSQTPVTSHAASATNPAHEPRPRHLFLLVF